MDDEGAEFTSEPAALQQAEAVTREMAAESVRGGHLTLSHRLVVANDFGKTVATIRFGDVVEVLE